MKPLPVALYCLLFPEDVLLGVVTLSSSISRIKASPSEPPFFKSSIPDTSDFSNLAFPRNYELSANDLDIIAKCGNRTLHLSDIVYFSFGIKFQLLGDLWHRSRLQQREPPRTNRQKRGSDLPFIWSDPSQRQNLLCRFSFGIRMPGWHAYDRWDTTRTCSNGASARWWWSSRWPSKGSHPQQ